MRRTIRFAGIVLLAIVLSIVLTQKSEIPTAKAAPHFCYYVTAIPSSECYALFDLYGALDGDNWVDNTNWKTNTDPDTWYGVVVWDGHVYQLHLNENSLSGTIPSAIGNFPELIELFMRGNSITGNIPSEIGDLGSLQGLQLQTNQLTGTIPANFANLTSIRSLYLDSNQLSGNIPSFFGSLSDLRKLNLSHNSFNGSLPTELGSLTALDTLYIQNTDLSGAVPSSFTSLSMEYFYYHGTDLCEPQDTPFQTWISGITSYFSSGLDCPYIANPTFPSADIYDTTPLFTWEKDEGATEYRFYLNNSGGNIENNWLDESAVCGLSTCSYDSGTDFPVGNYSWAIQTRNDTVSGPWSGYLDFSIGSEPVSPSGRINDVRPTYTWEEWFGADDYRLFVTHAAAGTVVNEWYEATDICSLGFCDALSNTHLQTGNHSFTFQARSDDMSINHWSTYMPFKLLNSTSPTAAIVPISPTGGEITSANPTYTWNEVSRASWYKVFIGSNTTGKVYNAYHRAAEVCYGTACTITPTDYLLSGSPVSALEYDVIHNWYVMPVNVAGNGSWSAAHNFRVEPAP